MFYQYIFWPISSFLNFLFKKKNHLSPNQYWSYREPLNFKRVGIKVS